MSEVYGFLSVIAGFTAAAFYWRSMAQGHSKPHPYTYLVWFMLAAIGAAAQLSGGAGPGAWVSFSTAAICFIIFVWSLDAGHKEITRSDKVSLAAALLIIPVWLMTHSPMIAVLLVSFIDFLGCYPTFQKSWRKPYEENLTAWSINVVKLGLSLLAMDAVNFVTVFYPASFMVLNVAFVIMCLARRRAMSGL